jgi:hypothetical protein
MFTSAAVSLRAAAPACSIAAVRASACVLLFVAACASGEDNRRRFDAGSADVPAGGDDAPPAACDPPCPTGYACDGTICVPAGDLDGDGVPSDRDCDDASAAVGSMAERPCRSSCADGVERCTEGRWAACTAPSDCDCTPGEAPRMVPCLACGMQRQVCDGGTWRDDGACGGGGVCSMGDVDMGAPCGACGVQARTCGLDCTWGEWTCAEEGECTRGMLDTETGACGACGNGTRTRTRTCSDTCGWGAWSEWSACSGGERNECAPGETRTETGVCGNCDLGRRTRTISCDVAAGCVWSAPGAWSACSGGGACAPGETTACSPADTCGHRVCSGACTWGACEPLTPGGCLRIRPGTTGPAGNNYRCCPLSGPDPSGWQFCLPSCSWSTACEATTSC